MNLSLIKNIKNDETIYNELINASDLFFNQILNISLTEKNQCYDFLIKDNKQKEILRRIFEYSGEEISDLGNEIECEKLEYEYYIFIYSFSNFTSFTPGLDEGEQNEIFLLLNM